MLKRVGHWAIERAANAAYGFGFFFKILKETALFVKKRQVGYDVLIKQILFTGVDALKITAVMAVAIGSAINIIGSSLLPQFGQSQLMYTILIVIIAKELGPLLTAFVVIARSGTAIATELGSMVISHEIEAYVSVGVNPLAFIAVPRFIGVTVSMVVLTVYFNIFGLLGSYLVTQVIKPIEFGLYFSNLLHALTVQDLLSGILKSFVFGVIVSVTSMFQGFAVGRASTEIPVAGIKAVSQGFMFCIAADVLLTVLQYI